MNRGKGRHDQCRQSGYNRRIDAGELAYEQFGRCFTFGRILYQFQIMRESALFSKGRVTSTLDNLIRGNHSGKDFRLYGWCAGAFRL